jgi:hypothetical protein
MPRLRLPTAPTSRPLRGQALVEFAIILPLLAVLLVMAIDFGLVFFGWVGLHNAARIAADYAARTADSWPSPAGGPIGAQARDRYFDLVVADLTGINCSPDDVVDRAWNDGDVPVPVFRNPDGSTSGDVKEPGDHALVTLDCSFGLVTPLAEAILGGRVNLRAEAYFAINGATAVNFPTAVPFPTPTPAPTPVPGPTDCEVEDYTGLTPNAANDLWDAAGFTGDFAQTQPGNGWNIASQTLAPGTHPCTAAITVSPGATLTPAPTPAGPTPVPTPSCAVPTANFAAEPTSGRRPLSVQFTDTSTAPAGCAITAWNWDFGDGSPDATTQNVGHVFTYPGQGQEQRQFTVTLTVTNAGGSSQTTTVITVLR